MPESERILIGLWDTLIGDAFTRLLSEAGFQVTGSCNELTALLAQAARSEPDVLVVDGSSDVLATLRAALPDVRIVAVLGELDGPSARALVRHGVNGVIPLAAHSTEAIRILREVIDGHVVYPSAVLSHLASEDEPDRLSERQREVLHQVALGRSNDEIAERLFISRNTVKFHLREIYLRLGVRNRVEAVRAGSELAA